MTFITDEMRAAFEPGGAAAEMLRQRAEADPEFAEDIESLLESADWFTQWGERTPSIRCECCGTWVTQVPETGPPLKYPDWKPGIWEFDTGRRHTLRRCNWQRSRRLAQVPADTSAGDALARDTEM